jgi:hypothetical protein
MAPPVCHGIWSTWWFPTPDGGADTGLREWRPALALHSGYASLPSGVPRIDEVLGIGNRPGVEPIDLGADL